jgi:hypothetical protein
MAELGYEEMNPSPDALLLLKDTGRGKRSIHL